MQKDRHFTVLGERLEFSRQFASYEQELETMGKELAQHRRELQTIKRSLSWRLASPFRMVESLVDKWRMRHIGRDADTLRNSELFDSAWYLLRYPDVADRGIDPAHHYLLFGAKEGRDPGPGFDTKWYKSMNPDVMRSGVNPLIHYILFGKAERRLPLP